EVFEGMARMPNTRMNEAQNPMSLKERGDKSPNCPRLSWLLTVYRAANYHLCWRCPIFRLCCGVS
ncbi:MAG: hypothetical protein V3W41_10140, partial [Planctomycetota bacterium]